MGKYFGTDGIRGVAGEKLSAELAFKIGRAAATALTLSAMTNERQEAASRARPVVMIGRDTRISCDMLETALAAGLCSAGADVISLGVLPTPAIAYLTVKSQSDMGIVISASHNTFEYNGIKIFGSDGYKPSDEFEELIERLIDDDSEIRKAVGCDIGTISIEHGVRTNEYVKYLASHAVGARYGGRIAIDCANGAASETARLLFRQLHAEFEIIADEPDGVNINRDCGSMHLNYLQDMIKSGRFSIGIGFDGDADRCLIVDEKGNIIDGDMMLAMFARDMQQSGKLKNDAFIGTVVSNAGMDIFARENGFTFHRSDVGDRNVLEMMKERSCNLGGESSGHIIFSDIATTGDGQLTALMFLNILVSSGKTASELISDVPRLPQVMPSFKLTEGSEQRDRILAHPLFAQEIAKQEKALDGYGRIHIRPSGTEAIIRVLVEAKTDKLSNEIAQSLLDFMKTL
ncbi:MAG: phosphoglucosamine mutase [Oscillospiraceae bacterium]|nr:phosphoglucosamine mutase [Oscillospiraceae bacterium]